MSEVTTTAARLPTTKLLQHLGLSLLFCLWAGAAILLNWSGSFGLWLAWVVMWWVVWIVFAPLQIWWWSEGKAKFWRPIYAWSPFIGLLPTVFPFLLFVLVVLVVPRLRRWFFRVLMPADPPGWAIASELAKYEELRDKGYITPDQFEAKKAEILSAPG